MKLFVAIPAGDNRVYASTTLSLLDEQSFAQGAGVELQFAIAPGCSLLPMVRNQLAGDFLKSDADKMVFIDADVSWERGSLLKLALHDVDFVGGAYRFKCAEESYPVGWLPKVELWAEDGLLEVENLPGGFLCLTRAVFNRLRVAYPIREYSHQGWSGHAYFDAPFIDGQLYGEDTAFCRYWRGLGGKVWLDPELSLTHHDGGQAYPGHVGNFLRSRIPAQQEAA